MDPALPQCFALACLTYSLKKQRQLVENVYLLQLPEKQLVFLRVFQLTGQKQGWISVCELCLAAKHWDGGAVLPSLSLSLGQGSTVTLSAGVSS